jgi:cytochrome c-type biogenesis protein CcmH/NrfF
MIALRRIHVMFAAFAALSLAADTQAQTAAQQQLDRQAGRLYDQVMSPFCPGRTLTNCPSPQAQVLRDGIKDRLRDGATTDQIWDELYSVYGDQVRSVPRAAGFNLLAWILPALFFVLGAWLLIRWMRRGRRSTTAATPGQEHLDPELEARLQLEMSELESVT